MQRHHLRALWLTSNEVQMFCFGFFFLLEASVLILTSIWNCSELIGVNQKHFKWWRVSTNSNWTWVVIGSFGTQQVIPTCADLCNHISSCLLLLTLSKKSIYSKLICAFASWAFLEVYTFWGLFALECTDIWCYIWSNPALSMLKSLKPTSTVKSNSLWLYVLYFFQASRTSAEDRTLLPESNAPDEESLCGLLLKPSICCQCAHTAKVRSPHSLLPVKVLGVAHNARTGKEAQETRGNMSQLAVLQWGAGWVHGIQGGI